MNPPWFISSYFVFLLNSEFKVCALEFIITWKASPFEVQTTLSCGYPHLLGFFRFLTLKFSSRQSHGV